MIPLSLYIHIPWCERKCPYCDFNSHLSKTEVNQAAYVAALLTDLRQDLQHHQRLIGSREIQSIFIGGGTPSLFCAESIENLLDGVRQTVAVSPTAEVTLEANPGSAEANRFAGFKAAGVNRLSIGVQSFNNQHLQALGRVHDSSEAIAAASYARAAGIANFNLDLMFGLPEQNAQQALADLNQAIELRPTHLSCYQLTIEPNTLFHHRPPVRPSDDALWDMQLKLQARLKEAGYQQYEVSAYAHSQQPCVHNLNYWQFGDYLGIGAGAHGKLSGEDESVHRYWKIKHPATYQQRCEQGGDPAGDRSQVEIDQRPFEFMLNALRLSDGFDVELFEQRTFLASEKIKIPLNRHQDMGLVEVCDQRIRPTERGKTMIDSMLQDYLP